jgi:hypothetical protein
MAADAASGNWERSAIAGWKAKPRIKQHDLISSLVELTLIDPRSSMTHPCLLNAFVPARQTFGLQ